MKRKLYIFVFFYFCIQFNLFTNENEIENILQNESISIGLPFSGNSRNLAGGVNFNKGHVSSYGNGTFSVVLYPDYPALNVGTARYLVIRARTKFTSAKAFYLYMGTVGFHNPEKKAADQRIGVRFNTANDGNWITYVLDLKNDALKERAPTVKDANDKDIRIFDSFYLNLLVAGEMDIDYIAFVNKLSDVADITVDDSVRIMNGVTSGASTLKKTADLKN